VASSSGYVIERIIETQQSNPKKGAFSLKKSFLLKKEKYTKTGTNTTNNANK
jgi:hypothetical protein